jgi:bacterial/archaeal transporter family protein
VLPVLFFGIVVNAVIWAPFVAWSHLAPESFPLAQFKVQPLSAGGHLLLGVKSVIVAASWIFGYFALKHLPLSIAGPIRATAPLWVILLAVLLMGESPGPWQWLGIAVVLVAFYSFSLAGQLEGIRFHRDKWVGFLIIATLFGACSAIFDKYLLQVKSFEPPTVQAWFSIYLVGVMAPFYWLWRRGAWPRGTFSWRWSILLISLCLLIADFLYFTAISQEDALIAVISPIRRASVVVTFLGGILLHGEKNFRPKVVCLGILLAGIALLNLTSS